MSAPEPPVEPPAAEDPTTQLAPPPPPAPPPAQPLPQAASNPWVAPPREVWINPNRRTPVLIAAIVAALVLLGIGGVIGAAVSDHHDRGREVMFVPGYRNGPFGQYGPAERVLPPGRLPRPDVTPTPSKT